MSTMLAKFLLALVVAFQVAPSDAPADVPSPAAASDSPATTSSASAPTGKGATAPNNSSLAAAPPAEIKPPVVEAEPWYSKMLHTGAMGYMIAGGIFMWPILVMAIVAAGVTIERFRSLKMINSDTSELRQNVLTLLQNDRAEEALELCSGQHGPVPAVLTAGLRKYVVLKKLNYDPSRIEDQVVKAMEDYGVHIVAALERNLPFLATISSVAPMVGSVGTVTGMIILFRDIVEKMGTTNIIESAAAGIQLKLLVTVWGLLVGIPAYIAFNYFTTVINRYILNVEETASELIGAVTLKNAMREEANYRDNHATSSARTTPVEVR